MNKDRRRRHREKKHTKKCLVSAYTAPWHQQTSGHVTASFHSPCSPLQNSLQTHLVCRIACYCQDLCQADYRRADPVLSTVYVVRDIFLWYAETERKRQGKAERPGFFSCTAGTVMKGWLDTTNRGRQKQNIAVLLPAAKLWWG